MIGEIGQQVITQKYNRFRHRGVDLRSWDFTNNRLFPVVAPENMYIMRVGTDNYGNDFMVCTGDISGYLLKFIHVTFLDEFLQKDNGYKLILKNTILGYTQIKGNSKAHHLHFETWGVHKSFNPVKYFKEMNIPWRYK